MSKTIAVRIKDELLKKIEESDFNTTSECVIYSLEYYFNNRQTNVIQPYEVLTEQHVLEKEYFENKIQDLKDMCDLFKNQLKDLKIEYQKELDKKDEQLKIKDQQIFSLIAVQKDLTEKTTEQVKLLSERIGSKKWYQFWK